MRRDGNIKEKCQRRERTQGLDPLGVAVCILRQAVLDEGALLLQRLHLRQLWCDCFLQPQEDMLSARGTVMRNSLQ